jgi:hypothetical protein
MDIKYSTPPYIYKSTVYVLNLFAMLLILSITVFNVIETFDKFSPTF